MCGLLFTAVSVANALERRPESPAFSPDGKQIAYSDRIYLKPSDIAPSSQELWVINSDSSGARCLTRLHKDSRPRWSPDSKKLLFVRDADVWVINSDGTDLKNITNTAEAIEDFPEWSNDGKGFFFLRDRPTKIGGTWWPTGNVVGYKDLATGKESRILDTEFGTGQVVPDLVNNGRVYIVCKPLLPDGKPNEDAEYGTDIIATVDVATAKVTPFFSLSSKQFAGRRLRQIHVAKDGLLVDVLGSFDQDQLAILRNGVLKFFPRYSSSADITRDGTRLVTTSINKYALSENWGLRLYDAVKSEPLLNIETGVTDPFLLKAKDAFVRGNVHYDAERYSEGLKEFSEAIRLNPNFANAYFNRALCYWMLDNYDDTIADCSKVLELNKVDGNAHLQRGEAYAQKGEHDKAIGDFTSASVLLPQKEKPAAIRKRAASYRARGFESLAAEDELKAAELEKSAAT